MKRLRAGLTILLLCAGALTGRPQDLATAPSAELLQVYHQLRALQGSNQGAVTEGVVFKRDAATFTFTSGNLTFAAPVAGRVVAAVFQGDGTFELDPPTAIDQRQIARFAGGPKLVDKFQSAVFFFTDDTWSALRKLVRVQANGNAHAAAQALTRTQAKFEKSLNAWWANASKGNPPMRNLAARMLADLTDPTSQGLFLADFKGEHYGDLLFEIDWNRGQILLPQVSNDDEVMLLHYHLGEYFEWWAGFHTATDYELDRHPDSTPLYIHCSNETIDAAISKSRISPKLAATAEMQFRVVQGTPRVLPLNLDGVLRISSVTDGAGKPLSFIQEARDLDSDPWLVLPAPAITGREYTVKIAYQEDSTQDSRIIFKRGTGLYYVTSRESWYPSFGAFDDRTMFDLRFHSPEEYQFIATGDLISSRKEGRELVTEWKSPIAFPVAGFNYGDFVHSALTANNLTVTTYSGKEVPDELKGIEAAANQAQLAAGPGGGDVEAQTGIEFGGFNTADSVKRAAAISMQAMDFYKLLYGPLPFKTVSVTEQPVRGYAQSWPMLIFLPYDSLLDTTTLNELGLYSSPEEREFYNEVAVHEMSHQWWGHLVGWKTYHDQWLSEGFADFSAAQYIVRFQGMKSYIDFWDLDRKWLLSKDPEGQRPVDVAPLWLNYQADTYHDPDLSTILIYRKGAYVLEMLRLLMEDPRSKDPNASFIAMMHDYVSTYAGKNASTEDFERIVEKHMHQPMNWFFNEWVYGTGAPHYDLKYQLRNAGGGKTLLTLAVTQSGVPDSFRMSVPVYAVFKQGLALLGMMNIAGSRTVTGKITLPIRPKKIELDATHSVLCTISE